MKSPCSAASLAARTQSSALRRIRRGTGRSREISLSPPLIQSRAGGIIEVDYLVKGKTATSLVNAMTATVPSVAHANANEVLRRWYALADVAPLFHRVTLFDDAAARFKDDDLRLLETLSVVIPLSAPESIRDTLSP